MKRIRHDFEQGSDEWLNFRLGKISGSNADKLITATGKKSSQADGYLAKLVAQTIESAENFTTDAMQRGIDLEPQARLFCEHAIDDKISQIGCVSIADTNIMCSPDGILGNKKIKGIYEAKCPNLDNHILYLLSQSLTPKYKPQIMFNMWVCEAEYAYYHSYHPKLKSLIVKVVRDEEYIKNLADIVLECNDRLNEIKKRIML